MLNPENIYERLVKLGDEWADAQEVAELMEETKKTLVSQLASDSDEKSIAARESEALRSDEYKAHIETMVKARKGANKAKVRYDSAKIWSELLRTKAATERAANRSAT